MKTVNMHDAKTHLSRLVEEAVQGKPFRIARNGTPLVEVKVITAQAADPRGRIGFMDGAFDIPDDFDQIGSTEIREMFEAG